MAKKNNIYCVYCGTSNVLEDKKCKKCKKQLDPKNRPFRDYMVDKLKDKVEGDIQDNIFSLIVEFIKTHLYGVLLTCSIVFTVTAGISGGVKTSNNFDVVDTKPSFEVQLEYKGEGLTPEEIVVKYGEALNNNDINSIKSYELSTFYPDIYEELKGSKVEVNGVVHFEFLDKNEAYRDSAMLFKKERLYDLGIYYSGTPKGKYKNYEFVRQPLYLEYGYADSKPSDDDKEEGFGFMYSIEFIKIDGNYYISGTQLDTFMSIEQEMHYKFLERYKGDTSKFVYKDVLDYIDEIDG